MEKGFLRLCVSVRRVQLSRGGEGTKSRKRQLPEVLWRGLYMKTLIAPGLLLRERRSEGREQRVSISVLQEGGNLHAVACCFFAYSDSFTQLTTVRC